MSAAAIAALIWITRQQPTSRAQGDGWRPETYGFNLATLHVPRSTISASGFAKGEMKTLDRPRSITAAQAEAIGKTEPWTYLAPQDRVVGVESGGMARAYPLRLLNWHGIVNDNLGGQEIAVTFSPLTDSALVFSRRVEGERLDFGVSGLLCNSNLLLYDRRRRASEESLWSQLQMRAIAGPAAAAGKKLTPWPAEVITWGTWRDKHPHTEVLDPDRALASRYLMDPYAAYLENGRIHFPVQPLPPSPPAYKARILAVRQGDRWIAYPFDLLLNGSQHLFSLSLSPQRKLRFACQAEGPSCQVSPGDRRQPLTAVTALWFAWYAAHPAETSVFTLH